MAIISKQEEKLFLQLYNRDGYVLNFNNITFNAFTTESIGEAVQTKYGLSKGKSLVAYLNDAKDSDRTKLLIDLFHYYKNEMEYEYNKEFKDDLCQSSTFKYNEHFAKVYLECKSIVDRLGRSTVVTIKTAEELKEKFSSAYLSRQIDLMMQMQLSDPTNAIGMAKELIESCCKTILDEKGISYTKDDGVSQLASKTMESLNLLPSNIQSTDRGADAIKAALGSLRAIPTKLAEIRNPFGSGHGKSVAYKGLEIRHAKLAVGSSITFVDFIWNTYEESKSD